MQVSFIETGFFKLDGGAMFGIVPQTLWKRLNPPDEQNLCTWALRCLLIEVGNRKILVDTGLGDKQDAKFRSYFHPHGEHTLVESLAAKGLQPEDITDVLITHLHFDHVGGAVRYDEGGKLVPTFPNAVYWSCEPHWQWAMTPNPREKASFLQENFVPLRQQGQLQFIDWQKEDVPWLEGIQIRFVNGHTEAMMLPILQQDGRQLVYCADLLPSSFHVRMPYVMAYDVRPLDTLQEKAVLLEQAEAENWLLCFEHDPATGAAYLTKDQRGRTVIGNPVRLEDTTWGE